VNIIARTIPALFELAYRTRKLKKKNAQAQAAVPVADDEMIIPSK